MFRAAISHQGYKLGKQAVHRVKVEDKLGLTRYL